MPVHRIHVSQTDSTGELCEFSALFDPATGQLRLESPQPAESMQRPTKGRLHRIAARLVLVLGLAGGAYLQWMSGAASQPESPRARVILREDVDPSLQRAALGIPLSAEELTGRSCHTLWMTLAWSFGRHHPVVSGPALRLFQRQSPGWRAIPGRTLTEVHQEHFSRFDRANERAVRAAAAARGCRPL